MIFNGPPAYAHLQRVCFRRIGPRLLLVISGKTAANQTFANIYFNLWPLVPPIEWINPAAD